MALPLRSNGADIPFDTLRTRLPCEKGSRGLSLRSPSPVITRSLGDLRLLKRHFHSASGCLLPPRCSSFLIRRPSKRLPRDKGPMSQRVRGSAGTLHSGCDKTSLVHAARGSVTWKESHVPSWARDVFFCWFLMCRTGKANRGHSMRSSLRNKCRQFHHASACVTSHKGALGEEGGGKKKKEFGHKERDKASF